MSHANSLRRIKMFHRLGEPDVRAALEVMREQRYETGAVVFHQGANGDTLVVVMDGILRVEVTDHDGVTATVGTIQTGEVVGEMAVIDPAPRSATVIAATDVILLELSRSGLDRLRKSSPSATAGIVGGIIGDVTRRLRTVTNRIDTELDPDKAGVHGSLRKTGLGDRSAPSDEPGVLRRLWQKIAG
ncbi:MAG: cyclic nucleotide-binding domain-containing protein [Myxococcales bacterium]|nr:cyclic nucleotide-binding domain-containing protein [Myxococcales bacterium]